MNTSFIKYSCLYAYCLSIDSGSFFSNILEGSCAKLAFGYCVGTPLSLSLYLIMGEKESHFTLGFKLNGSNYHIWAGNMEAHIKGKGLRGYVLGTIPEPEPKITVVNGSEIKVLEGEERVKALEEYSKKHDEWEMKNFKILSWFFSSVETKINANIIKFKKASEAWHYLEKMYTSRDLSHKYYLQKKALSLTQGEMTIREYFADLSSVWMSLPCLNQNGVEKQLNSITSNLKKIGSSTF